MLESKSTALTALHRARRCAAAAAVAAALAALPALGATTQQQFDEALQMYEAGHFAMAAQALAAPAAAGDRRALEMLGLMHWYGRTLYAPGPWDRSQGRALLARAAGEGSEVAAATLRSSVSVAATAATAGLPMQPSQQASIAAEPWPDE